MKSNADKKLGYLEVTAIGIGGMVGGGIFAVLGLAVSIARGGTPVAFAIAGMIALVTAYSYKNLSITYPSSGGTVIFIDKAFGSGLLTGATNILLLLSYIIMLSLYAYAFGGYSAGFFSPAHHNVVKHIISSTVIISITVLNMLEADIIGKVETWIVLGKLLILLIFITIGVPEIDIHRIAVSQWPSGLRIAAGGMIIFLAYEGFELIANTAEDVRDYKRTLTIAYYSSVIFVILLYVLIAFVAVGNLPIDKIVASKDYALAEAAKPFMGSAGYTLIAVAALLSTGSAINATLYGATRLTYIIAKEGELPTKLEKKIWHKPLEGLLLTSTIALLITNFFDLSSISIMGSSAFLIIFAVVNSANTMLSRQTKSKAWISATGTLICICAIIALIGEVAIKSPEKLWILVIMLVIAFGMEIAYRMIAKREIYISKG